MCIRDRCVRACVRSAALGLLACATPPVLPVSVLWAMLAWGRAALLPSPGPLGCPAPPPFAPPPPGASNPL
eukprot:14173210-Alexandrium_andersonii.AAC.1